MRRLRIVRADPAGNITLFVLTPVEKAACAAIAADLMTIGELKAEQVGFVFPTGHMEMEAGEFCGNASVRGCGGGRLACIAPRGTGSTKSGQAFLMRGAGASSAVFAEASFGPRFFPRGSVSELRPFPLMYPLN